MADVFFAFVLVSLQSQAIAAWLQSALYRHQGTLFSYGNFTRDLHCHLVVTKITSVLVEGQFGCTFKCNSKPECYSFNLAAYADSDGLYLCELLATDKYRAAINELQANATFHHFSPWVSKLHYRIIEICWNCCLLNFL